MAIKRAGGKATATRVTGKAARAGRVGAATARAKNGAGSRGSKPKPARAKDTAAKTRKRSAKVARETPKRAKEQPAAKVPRRPPASSRGVRRLIAKGPGPAMPEVGAPVAVPGLSEEDQIREAKYLPRELPKRLFEEERFVFPETYGQDRIRLLVRDPEWIFAYWDVNPASMKDLARGIGERSLALSRLTLRIVDPGSGAVSDILLPPGARWWYVRTDGARRTYRAELGVTLPSGEYKRLAESNTVVTPRVGPSVVRAGRRLSYRDAGELPVAAAERAAEAERRSDLSETPWEIEGRPEPDEAADATTGGASDAFAPGRGASDGFRR